MAALIVAATLLTAPASGLAQSDVPEGRFAVVLGGRENVGSLGAAFGRGWLAGVEAGYQPGRLGVAWSITWGQYNSDDAMRVDTELRLTEMQFGLRVRWPIGQTTPRFLVGAGGVSLMRANIPIPPDAEREYLGPYAGVGMEQLLLGRYMLGLEARYGMFVGGPGGLTVNLSLAFGSR